MNVIREGIGRSATATVVVLAMSMILEAGVSGFETGRIGLVTVASADDGDDGGDDGGSGSGGGTGGAGAGGSDSRFIGRSTRGTSDLRRFFGGVTRAIRPQRRATRRNAARAPVQAPAVREIVGLDISEQQIVALEGAGFDLLERADLGTIGTSISRLRVPTRLSLEAARVEILVQAPQALLDDNHLYAPQTDTAPPCLSTDCLARTLIDWHILDEEVARCASHVRLGMIDTGINIDHDVFKGARIELVRLGNTSQPSSLQHGTAIAALLVGTRDGRAPGLLPGASLVAVDTFSRRPSGDVSDAFTLVRGLDLLLGRDVDVVNLSLAGPANAVVERAVAKAEEAGTLLVAAAGNEGPRARAVYPAAYPSVLAVTAVDRRKRAYRRAGQGQHIDIAAPGVDVWTVASVSGARTRTGTSYAAPFVAAAAAAWFASVSDASPSGTIDAIAANAEDLGEPGKDRVFGWGLIRPTMLCRAPTAD